MNKEFEQASGNITLALDNTAEYEDWLIVQSYIDIYKQALNEIRECCENNAIEVNTREYGNLIVTNIDDILQIIDKFLGGSDE